MWYRSFCTSRPGIGASWDRTVFYLWGISSPAYVPVLIWYQNIPEGRPAGVVGVHSGDYPSGREYRGCRHPGLFRIETSLLDRNDGIRKGTHNCYQVHSTGMFILSLSLSLSFFLSSFFLSFFLSFSFFLSLSLSFSLFLSFSFSLSPFLSSNIFP